MPIIKYLSDEDINTLLKDFKWLHAHPEFSYEEFETTTYLRTELEKANVPILPYALKTGLVAEITGVAQNEYAPTIALRADIDALPVLEACDIPHRSIYEGKMHACGHDLHAAVLLNVAKWLWLNRAEFSGTVRCIFQPAEEAGLGVLDVLEYPVMQDVSAVYGLHTSPLYPVGTIGLRAGAVTASVNRFEIKLKGRGVHAAYPEDGIDTIVMAANIVTALQSVISRNTSPHSTALLSITELSAGNTWNVLPQTAYLQGTVRTLCNKVRAEIPKHMHQIIDGVCAAFGGTAEFLWHEGPSATMNNAQLVELCAEVAKEIGQQTVEDPASMLGDDFALLAERAKGVYIHTGIGVGAPNHNPSFYVEEKSLECSAEFLIALTLRTLKEQI